MVQCAARQPASAYSDALHESNSADRVGGVMLLALGGRECHRPLSVGVVQPQSRAATRCRRRRAAFATTAIILQAMH